MTASCIFEGYVRHRRFAPVGNDFTYRIFMMYLDLDELPNLFKGRLFWSMERPNVASFRRSDHFGDPALPIKEIVRRAVAEKTGVEPRGPIRLLTHLRYFGYCFNPVSFYYCLDPAGRRVETIVAEVANTPWGERYCYVLSERMNEGSQARKRFRFKKAFHVSPFMPMELSYDWRFSEPGSKLFVHMENLRDGKFFDATMALQRREADGLNLARVLALYPWMTGKVIAAIYYQSAKLWIKGAPFHPHPKHTTWKNENAS